MAACYIISHSGRAEKRVKANDEESLDSDDLGKQESKLIIFQKDGYLTQQTGGFKVLCNIRQRSLILWCLSSPLNAVAHLHQPFPPRIRNNRGGWAADRTTDISFPSHAHTSLQWLLRCAQVNTSVLILQVWTPPGTVIHG